MFQWLDNLEAKYFGTWKGKFVFYIGLLTLSFLYGLIDRQFIKGTGLEIWKDNFSIIWHWCFLFFVFWTIFYWHLWAKDDAVKFWKYGFMLCGGFLLIPASGYFLHGTPLKAWDNLWVTVSVAAAFIFTMWGLYKQFIVSKGSDVNWRDVVAVMLCGLLLVPSFLLLLFVIHTNML